MHRGCDAAVHATHSSMAQLHSDKVLLEFDVKNVFNSIRWDSSSSSSNTPPPEIYLLLWDSFSSNTHLFYGEFCLDSATDVRQGDPFSQLFLPLLSIMELHPRSNLMSRIFFVTNECFWFEHRESYAIKQLKVINWYPINWSCLYKYFWI